ncbi:MAG: hypothetical protein EXR86_14185 [Gammaproteobacteria bacterium]|nr:hypothetical protein [Gammaproteobacteria bacterium]
MTSVIRAAAVLVLAAFAPEMFAEEAAITPSYRSPGDMTVDERTAMMSLVGEYNNCVYQEGVAQVDKFADIRQAADAAMEACENTVNKLRATIDSYGFEPGFSEQFVHHAQSRAARTLLPELAIRKSS